MPTNTELDRQIHARIASFIEDIDALVRQAALEAVNEALGGRASARVSVKAPKAGKATKKARRTSAKKGKRVRRTGAQVEALATRIKAHVKANPGQRLGEIAKALRQETKDVRRPAFMLLEDGSLRTEGERGGTRYFPKGAKAAAAKRTRKKAAKKAKRRNAAKTKAAKAA